MAVDQQDATGSANSQLEKDYRAGEVRVTVKGDDDAGYAVSVKLPTGESLAAISTRTKEEAGKAIYRVICDITRRLDARPT